MYELVHFSDILNAEKNNKIKGTRKGGVYRMQFRTKLISINYRWLVISHLPNRKNDDRTRRKQFIEICMRNFVKIIQRRYREIHIITGTTEKSEHIQ